MIDPAPCAIPACYSHAAIFGRRTELVMQGRGQIARGALMANIIAHGNEMYGVSGVYLRAKNIVPPSTERQPMRGDGRGEQQ